MEQKIALVNSLALIYHESKLGERGRYNALIKKVIASIKTPELMADGDSQAALAGVKSIVKDLVEDDLVFDRKAILQKIRIYCSLDQSFYKNIEHALSDDEDSVDDVKKTIASYASQLSLYSNRSEMRRLISRASFAVNNDAEANLKEVAQELQHELSKLNRHGGNAARPSLVASVGTDNPEGFEKIFENTKRQLEGNVLKTGWKFLNRMMGINNGIVPGELWLMPALPHNAKTTFSLMLSLSLGLFNDPAPFVPEGKKAMILDLSFENELETNLPIAYKAIKENLEGVPVNIKDIDPAEASKYVCDKLRERGWEYKFERHINSAFEISALEETFALYESQGYHIVVCRADYLGTINRAGLGNGTIGSDVRELYRLARNVCAPRKCALLAPHQLSPKAKELKSIDPMKYVRLLPGKGYYDGCTTVDNEADGELYFGITEVNEQSFLEVQRGKHRTLVDTPVAHRYRVIPFSDMGTLPWDVHLDKDNSIKSVNTNSILGEMDGLFG
jgi:ribosomal protein S20